MHGRPDATRDVDEGVIAAGRVQRKSGSPVGVSTTTIDSSTGTEEYHGAQSCIKTHPVNNKNPKALSFLWGIGWGESLDAFSSGNGGLDELRPSV